MLHKRFVQALSFAILMLTATGCQLYVNVPAQSGDVARNNPNISVVRKCEALAVQRVAHEWKFDGVVEIKLPEGTLAYTYQQVLDGLGNGFVAADGLDLKEINGPSARYNREQTILQADTAKARAKIELDKEDQGDPDVIFESKNAQAKAKKLEEQIQKTLQDAKQKNGKVAGSLEVTQVAIRGWEGWVDVVKDDGGFKKLFRVRFKYLIGQGWKINRVDERFIER